MINGASLPEFLLGIFKFISIYLVSAWLVFDEKLQDWAKTTAELTVLSRDCTCLSC